MTYSKKTINLRYNYFGRLGLSNLTVEYWIDDGWYVGKLKEIPGVFSQGETIEELIENLKDAYSLILKENQYIPVKDFKTVEININL